jgi:hypothetical protein
MVKTIKMTANPSSPLAGVRIAAFLMILFGLLEIVTGFTHRFFILSTSSSPLSLCLGVGLGFFYFMAGCLILTGRRRAAILAILLLVADIIGRAAMVVTGLYPLNSIPQTYGIVIGTSIVFYFSFYVGGKLKFFK